ncbi:MAG: M48 family peptidase, partial [Ghiorsea sp.]|nr:M48 family peptidase [Ghiorsea sp.]
MLTFTLIFLIALFISTAIDFWLDQRQLKAVHTHKHEVPARFKGAISLEAHQKAASYTTTKIKVGTWAGAYGLGLLLIWTLGGGLDALDEMIRSWG